MQYKYDARCTHCGAIIEVDYTQPDDQNEPGYFSPPNYCPQCGYTLQYDVIGLHEEHPPVHLYPQVPPPAPVPEPAPVDNVIPFVPPPFYDPPLATDPAPLPDVQPPAAPDTPPPADPAPAADIPAPDDPVWGDHPGWGAPDPQEEVISITRGALRAAIEHALDASQVVGTGQGGTITLSDVLASIPLG